MAERSASVACKKFSANVFDKNKCQNCFKTKDAHVEKDASPTSARRPTNLDVGVNRSKTTVKSGSLSIATQISPLPETQVQKWENVWLMLYTSGDLEWFPSEATTTSLGIINLDECIGLTSAEVDTNEPFSIGIKTVVKTHYLKAENRLEMDNWCRVLKPFVNASPGYKIKKSPTTRAVSLYDSKIGSPTNTVPERKSSLSRTVSAPWQAQAEQKATGSSLNNVTKKRWSATEDLLARKEEIDKDGKKRPGDGESTNSKEKQVERDPAFQPYYSDLYLAPDPSEQKQNGETSNETSNVEKELMEAKRLAKHSQGKADMCSRNLADAKKQLEKANNIISVQKMNITELTSEVDALKTRLRPNEELAEKHLKDHDSGYPTCNGTVTRDDIESGFIKLQSKLQENEKALIRRTRELEKANESRKKVAKHTRALLVELEEKLTENNQRINELEEQLMNKTLDLQFEKEERQRIEREKGQLAKNLSSSNLQSKQREITKRSTELLQQARDDHRLTKNELKAQQEIESLNRKLEAKSAEVQKLQAGVDKRDGEVRILEEEYKKANNELLTARKELGMVNESLSKEKTKCSQLESRVEDILVKVKENEKKTREIQRENSELQSEIERTRKECETQVLLLQEDNETTRIRLHEVQEELDALHTETDGAHPNELEDLTRTLEETRCKSEKREEECKKLQEMQVESIRDFNNEKNKRLKVEKDLKQKSTELNDSLTEVEKLKEFLRVAEEKFETESKRVSELEGKYKSTVEASEQFESKSSQELGKLHEEIRKYETESKELKGKYDESDRVVLELNKELEKRSLDEEKILSKIESVLKSFDENQSCSNEALSSVNDGSREKRNTLDAIECLSTNIERLNGSLGEEKERTLGLEQLLRTSESAVRKCSVCEKRAKDDSSLVEELENAKENHREELEKLQETMKNESQTLKSQAEELKLKLTSKVILLQSDISELNAKHERELSQVNEQREQEVDSLQEKHDRELSAANEQHKQEAASRKEEHHREFNEQNERHKKEIESWQDKCETLTSSSDEERCRLREKVGQLEAQLLSERESNKRNIESLKQEFAKKATESEVGKNGVISLQEFEEAKEHHSKELEEIKENHRKELEENKTDMMMVLQALKSDSYQSSSMSNESLEMNDDLKKLERYVETLKKDHEEEIKRLNQEHEQDLEQLRSDMVTLLRVQETYKTSDDGKADPTGKIVDLDGQLLALKRSHEKEMREKEAQHKKEVDQLKSDMLVAIQAASAVGNISSQASTSSRASPNERVAELEQHIANLERDFEEERENLQNAIKKAESATKFGLRRNEEMSNKIYQMQREMEEIDTKYQKEVKLYKEAFDQEKNRKTTIGAVPGILAENESLKVKLQELDLSMEQMQVRYDGEIKRYKEKFQQDNVLSVEELQLKIKSLEDSIEQMRLEHETEVERYTKAVKRGKVSLTSTVKERDLERKIDDLESKIDIMRKTHREEIRKYRERLEDEMERHRKENSESRAKLRKLEADTRQMDELKNKITELENKTAKLTKDASKCKEQEVELNETRSKNRELQRQVDGLKRKVDKLEEAAEENKESSNESSITSSRAKLSRYSSSDNIGSNSSSKTKGQATGQADDNAANENDVFEMNNNSGKTEIGGYKLNTGPKRPASVSAFPVQNENGTRKTTYSEKRRDSGSTSNRSTYQPAYLKTSTSASSLK